VNGVKALSINDVMLLWWDTKMNNIWSRIILGKVTLMTVYLLPKTSPSTLDSLTSEDISVQMVTN